MTWEPFWVLTTDLHHIRFQTVQNLMQVKLYHITLSENYKAKYAKSGDF